MKVLLFILGILLVLAALVDALWTTLWVDGHAGSLTMGLTAGVRHSLRLAARGRGGRILSLTGPLVQVAIVGGWLSLLWAGWAILFSADPGAVVSARTGAIASFWDRVYFTAYALSTMGNGDFVPRGAGWEVATGLAAFSGLFLFTLAVTFLVAVLNAVVRKRAFATQVMALGERPDILLVRAWDGHGFRALDGQLASLADTLAVVNEQHQAYPVLHDYEPARPRHATVLGVIVLDEAVTLLEHAVDPACRPSPSVLRAVRMAVSGYIDTLGRIHDRPADRAPPAPTVETLRHAGIPAVDDRSFRDGLSGLDERRRRLLAIVEAHSWDWPSAA